MATQYKISFTLTVTDEWIEDGFSLTPENLREIIQAGILDYATDNEKEVSDIEISEEYVEKLYAYDELSDKAKEKALEKFWDINVDYEWWDGITDGIAEFGEASDLGCEYGREFDLEGKQFIHIKNIRCQFSELYTKWTGEKDGKKIYCVKDAYPGMSKAVLEPFFKSFSASDIRHIIMLEKWQLLGELRGSTSTDRHGKRFDLDLPYVAGLRPGFGALKSQEIRPEHYCYPRVKALCDKLENAWGDLLTDLEHYYVSTLRREYEYQTSLEQVEESIRCNKYQFTENGELA